MVEIVPLILGAPLIIWAFHRVFIWPLTRNRAKAELIGEQPPTGHKAEVKK